MMNLSRQLVKDLDEQTINKISAAPKPTPTAEVIAVVKQFDGKAFNLEEIAEILNIAEPLRRRVKASDFNVEDLRKHPELRVLRSLNDVTVKYVRK